MEKFDKNSKIGEVVAARPSLARVMDRFGLSYCCGGGKSLELACSQKDVDVEEVLKEIEKAMAAPPEENLTELPLAELVEHVLNTHHSFLRETLPVVTRQLDRVVTVHGSKHPELAKAQSVFKGFVDDMNQHMEKEEQLLFPVISTLGGSQEHPDAGKLEGLIETLEAEHDHSGKDMTTIRRLLNDYEPPEGACGTYRAVLKGLEDIELDTQQHVLAENSIMFPKAIKQVAARV